MGPIGSDGIRFAVQAQQLNCAVHPWEDLGGRDFREAVVIKVTIVDVRGDARRIDWEAQPVLVDRKADRAVVIVILPGERSAAGPI